MPRDLAAFCRHFMAAMTTLCALCSATPTQAGPWLQEEGDSQLIASVLYYRTDHFINNAGQRRAQPVYAKTQLNPYVEYGLSARWTIGASAFLDHINSDAPGGESHNLALADTEIFARTPLYQQDNFILSLEPAVKFPSFYQHAALPRSGTKEWDARLGLGAGYSFDAYGNQHYISIEPGFRHRFGAPGDQFYLNLGLGLRPAESWQFITQLFTAWRLSDRASFTQSSYDDYSLAKLQFSVVYEITPALAFQIGAFHHLYARNTGTGGGVTAAIWKKF